MNDNERIEELEPTEETQFPEENLENDIDDEEMTGEEVQDEIQDDEEEKVKDDIEQPFYAVTPEYDELRPVLSELDYRLFLINNDLVLIGRLNGADIEIMVNSGNDEESEYTFVKAPGALDELKKIANVIYLSPDMTDEDKAEYEGKEANHESVMEYLMNLLPEITRDEMNQDELEETHSDIPEVNEEEQDEDEDEDIEEVSEEDEEEEE